MLYRRNDNKAVVITIVRFRERLCSSPDDAKQYCIAYVLITPCSIPEMGTCVYPEIQTWTRTAHICGLGWQGEWGKFGDNQPYCAASPLNMETINGNNNWLTVNIIISLSYRHGFLFFFLPILFYCVRS